MVSKYGQLCPVHFGNGAIDKSGEICKELLITRVLVVTDKSIEKIGIPQKAINSLINAGIEYKLYNGVEMDAPDYTVEEGSKIALEMKADAIVGVGGGSTLDTAKAIAIVAAGEVSVNELITTDQKIRNQVKIVLIPTTSGTGSENTIISVVTNTQTHYKAAVFAIPTAAIVDPELTLNIPRQVTMYTGADALSHACESLSGGMSPNPHSELLSFNALERIHKWLPVALKEPANLEARENLSIASNFAGIAFTDCNVHTGHAIAHSLGAGFHISHGIGCALALPPLIEYTSDICYDKYKRVGEIFGADISSKDPIILGKSVADAIRTFFKSIGIPSCEELNLSKEDVLSCSDYIMNEILRTFGQKIPDEKEVKSLLSNVYDGYK